VYICKGEAIVYPMVVLTCPRCIRYIPPYIQVPLHAERVRRQTERFGTPGTSLNPLPSVPLAIKLKSREELLLDADQRAATIHLVGNNREIAADSFADGPDVC
jgi:hypothetical protein